MVECKLYYYVLLHVCLFFYLSIILSPILEYRYLGYYSYTIACYDVWDYGWLGCDWLMSNRSVYVIYR